MKKRKKLKNKNTQQPLKRKKERWKMIGMNGKIYKKRRI
jgi:hypothetical protein